MREPFITGHRESHCAGVHNHGSYFTAETILRLYLDSAKAAEWRLPPGCPTVRGITTNPSLVHQAGLPVSLDAYCDLIARVSEHRYAELMLQLPRADVGEALDWVHRLVAAARAASVELTIKLPCHPDWLDVLKAVQSESVPTLFTGVSNPMQLLWAQDCGATYVAPYIGRLQADGREVWSFIEACVRTQLDGGPRLLAASVKSPDVLSKLIASGAYAVTVRPEFAAALVKDVLTQSAIEQFDADTQASRKQ